MMQTHLYFGVPATLGLFMLALLAARRNARVKAALDLLNAEARRRQEVEETLRQTQKTEAIGRLTGGIAHDFNNLLTVIGSSIENLSRAIPDPEARAQRCAASLGREAVKRAGRLTHRLLAFARQQPLAMQVGEHQPPRVRHVANCWCAPSARTSRSRRCWPSGLWMTRTDPRSSRIAC